MDDLKENVSVNLNILKECYELAARYEKLDAAKEIIREKTRQIIIPSDHVPIQQESDYKETEKNITTNAIYALNTEGVISEEKRLEALRYINSELNDKPGDPRYLTLASILTNRDK